MRLLQIGQHLQRIAGTGSYKQAIQGDIGLAQVTPDGRGNPVDLVAQLQGLDITVVDTLCVVVCQQGAQQCQAGNQGSSQDIATAKTTL